LVKLTTAITINDWNRLTIAFRPEIGRHQPHTQAEQPGTSP
jgi:hypothetical protein